MCLYTHPPSLNSHSLSWNKCLTLCFKSISLLSFVAGMTTSHKATYVSDTHTHTHTHTHTLTHSHSHTLSLSLSHAHTHTHAQNTQRRLQQSREGEEAHNNSSVCTTVSYLTRGWPQVYVAEGPEEYHSRGHTLPGLAALCWGGGAGHPKSCGHRMGLLSRAWSSLSEC